MQPHLKPLYQKIDSLKSGESVSINPATLGYAPRTLVYYIRDYIREKNLKGSITCSAEGSNVKINNKAINDEHLTSAMTGQNLTPFTPTTTSSSFLNANVRTTHSDEQTINALSHLISKGIIETAELISVTLDSLPPASCGVEYHQTPTGILIL